MEFGNCICRYGCPCQFEDIPTDGHCRGFEVIQIHRAMLDSTGGPIKPPRGDGEHRVRISVPDGIELKLAEIGSASTATSAIRLDLADCYGQGNILRHSGTGVVH